MSNNTCQKDWKEKQSLDNCCSALSRGPREIIGIRIFLNA